jgi:putative PIN family toxin of toxin-antitoxin system
VRIVLDTGVLFSGLLWRGTSYRLLQAIRSSPGIRIVASGPLIEELAEVLGRPGSAKRYALIGKTPAQVIADYLEAVELVEPAIISPRAVDADDDMVLAAALAGQSDLIVSSDSDLLNLKRYHAIDIVSVNEALKRIEREVAE